MQKTDIVVIGAGIIGSAIARELAFDDPLKKRIIVLEKLKGVGLETSRFNSGVLHSGLHENPNFLKSKLAQEGMYLALKYAREKRLSLLPCGMIVAVSGAAIREGLYKEWHSLFHLIQRGKKQSVSLKLLTGYGVKKLEPNIRALGGIFISNVAVIDPIEFTRSIAEDAEKNGVEFAFNSPVTDIKKIDGGYYIITSKEEYLTKAVINAAGLYADEVAAMAGFKYTIHPWRGEYYEVLGKKAELVKRLVYTPVPPGYPGKGIHFSPRPDGRLFLGPNARAVPEKNYYTEDKTPKDEFLAVAQRYCPEISADDLAWSYSGIRPKLVDHHKENDFVIRREKTDLPFINLIGIESPGLASSMAVAKYVTQLIKI